jgi:hypothetical protein
MNLTVKAQPLTQVVLTTRSLSDPMKRYLVTSLLLALLALVLPYPQHFISSSVVAQKRGSRRIVKPQATRNATTDYSKFSHATPKHQGACNTCHKIPTNNWRKAADYPDLEPFPDIADYPEHDACVSCHRAQFFKGAKPVICSVCHTKISPRDDARLTFRKPAGPSEFRIEFPHDRHQDVIAKLFRSPIQPRFMRTSFTASSFYADDKTQKYNNCVICHGASTTAALAPAAGWIDDYQPPVDTFKAVPENHASCFNCHWARQEPTKDNCAGCHKPGTPDVHHRISMKFRHEAGGDGKNHVGECTTCHINITKATTLQGLKPDVPIFPSCSQSSCHQKVLNEELNNYNKAPGSFKCVKCHTTDVGTKKPPNSHPLGVLG